MTSIYLPATGPESWKALLADPEKHWRTGYSARALAHCWQTAQGVPDEIKAVLGNCDLLIGLPEHKTRLPGGSRETQTDLLALLSRHGQTCMAAVEGKVREPFGPSLGDWLKGASEGKQTRLRYIRETLGLDQIRPTIRYQLLHRTCAAVIESQRFKTDEAALIVHSFAQDKLWFDDFAALLSLFGIEAKPETLHTATLPSGKPLHFAWITGNPTFLLA